MGCGGIVRDFCANPAKTESTGREPGNQSARKRLGASGVEG